MFDAVEELPKLMIIRFSAEFKHIHTVSNGNFTKLSAIEVIHLKSCGIKHIQYGAFNYISRTLTDLRLESNEIKTLAPWAFNRLIGTISYISLYDNALLCDCNFMELLYIGMWQNNTRFNTELFLFVECAPNYPFKYNTSLAEQCKNLQIIHLSKICFHLRDEEMYNYSKCRLKIVNDSLYITTMVDDPYRIWI